MKKERKERIAHEVDTITIEENVADTNFTKEEKEALRNFAINFNDILYKNNVKQDTFCEKLGISQGALSSYRNGKRFPESRILYAISKELNVSIDYLFGLSEIKKPVDDFKVVNHTTGLTDEAIEVLKYYTDCINDDDFQEVLKEPLKKRINAINLLIKHENSSRIFENIANYFWNEFSSNIEEMLKISKKDIYKEDQEEFEKIWGNKFMIKTTKNEMVSLDKSMFEKIYIVMVENSLHDLKNSNN